MKLYEFKGKIYKKKKAAKMADACRCCVFGTNCIGVELSGICTQGRGLYYFKEVKKHVIQKV